MNSSVFGLPAKKSFNQFRIRIIRIMHSGSKENYNNFVNKDKDIINSRSVKYTDKWNHKEVILPIIMNKSYWRAQFSFMWKKMKKHCKRTKRVKQPYKNKREDGTVRLAYQYPWRTRGQGLSYKISHIWNSHKGKRKVRTWGKNIIKIQTLW